MPVEWTGSYSRIYEELGDFVDKETVHLTPAR